MERKGGERVNLSTEGWIEVKENMILSRGLISTPSFSLPFRGVQYAFTLHFSMAFDNLVTVLTMCERTKTCFESACL